MTKLRFPKTNEWAYGLLLVLIVIVILFVFRINQYNDLHDALARETFAARIEAEAVVTEEHALGIPEHVFGLSDGSQRADSASVRGISFAILFDPSNCSNSLASDIEVLSAFHRSPSRWIHSVRGYYVSERHDLFDQFISLHKISFPVVKANPLEAYFDTTYVLTPLVLVIDASSQTVLDAHRPIPDDVRKSRLFYDKWKRLMKRYSPT